MKPFKQRDDALAMPIPLPGGKRWATLTVPRVMTEEEWEHLVNVMAVLKPGIVLDEDAARIAWGDS